MEMDVATTCSHEPGPLTVTHHHAQFSPLFDSIHFVAFLVPSIPPLTRLYKAAYVSESLDSTIAWSCLPFANSISHSLCPFASNCCRAPSPLEHYRHLYVPRSPSISAAHSYSTSWNDHRFLSSPSGSWARRVLCCSAEPGIDAGESGEVSRSLALADMRFLCVKVCRGLFDLPLECSS